MGHPDHPLNRPPPEGNPSLTDIDRFSVFSVPFGSSRFACFRGRVNSSEGAKVADPAIESDVGPPITAVPDVGAACIAPITGSPEEPRLRRHDPVAMNPEIAVLAI